MRAFTSILLILSWMSCFFNCSLGQSADSSVACGGCVGVAHGDVPEPGIPADDRGPTCPDHSSVLPNGGVLVNGAKGLAAPNWDGEATGDRSLFVGGGSTSAIRAGEDAVRERFRDYRLGLPVLSNDGVHIARPIRGPAA